MLNKHYLCWLMNQLQIAGGGPGGYLHLCEVLQNCAFLSLVQMDENRREEAIDLRYEASGDIQDIVEGPFSYTCSVLELLVVMVRRMNYEMLDSQYESGIGRWTGEIFANAGFDAFTNARFEADENAVNEAKELISDIVYRRYGFDGEGGFFPLKNPKHDQRYCELLTQMNDYIAENYDIC